MAAALKRIVTTKLSDRNMRVKQLAFAVAGAAALAMNASAVTIGPGNASWSGPDTSYLDANQISSILNGAGFNVGTLTELYQQAVGADHDSGLYASSYTSIFSNEPFDPHDVDIKYLAGSALTGFDQLWLYVKDGNHDPAYYLINLNLVGWNGTDDLSLRAFWPQQQGAISYISILGSTGSSSVPDGGTAVMMLGAALGGIAACRRMFKA
jgi:VPDSG-CTERM exosortase interaction domain